MQYPYREDAKRQKTIRVARDVEVAENTEYRRWTPIGCVPIDPANVDAGDTISIHGMVVDGVFVGDRVTVDVPLDCCTP